MTKTDSQIGFYKQKAIFVKGKDDRTVAWSMLSISCPLYHPDLYFQKADLFIIMVRFFPESYRMDQVYDLL